MTYPATTYAEGVELTITSGNQLHEIINGSATEEINTESGMVTSVRKALADSMLFKPAIAWAEGSVESDPFQTRLYGEGIYWAPAASNETPISMGNNPNIDGNWFLAPVTGGETISRNTNLLSNHNFTIQSPDDIEHPSVTPTDYVSGTQIFSGVFVGDDIVGLTYIDGRVSWTSGTLYFSVPNSGALEYVDQTDFVASVADFDGKPRTRGVSYALVGDEYRVTVGVDALEDESANETPLGSVKFEQGKVATGHNVGASAKELAHAGDSQIVGEIFPVNSKQSVAEGEFVPTGTEQVRLGADNALYTVSDGSTGVFTDINVTSAPFTVNVNGIEKYLLLSRKIGKSSVNISACGLNGTDDYLSLYAAAQYACDNNLDITLTDDINVLTSTPVIDGGIFRLRGQGKITHSVTSSIFTANQILVEVLKGITFEVTTPVSGVAPRALTCTQITGLRFKGAMINTRLQARPADLTIPQGGKARVQGNFSGDFPNAPVSDTSNILDIRGFTEVDVSGNVMNCTGAERFIKISTDVERFVSNHAIYKGDCLKQMIDCFIGTRNIEFNYNDIDIDNCVSVIENKVGTQVGIDSEHHTVFIKNNEVVLGPNTTSAFAIVESEYGSQFDNGINSICEIEGNVLTVPSQVEANRRVFDVRGVIKYTEKNNRIRISDGGKLSAPASYVVACKEVYSESCAGAHTLSVQRQGSSRGGYLYDGAVDSVIVKPGRVDSASGAFGYIYIDECDGCNVEVYGGDITTHPTEAALNFAVYVRNSALKNITVKDMNADLVTNNGGVTLTGSTSDRINIRGNGWQQGKVTWNPGNIAPGGQTQAPNVSAPDSSPGDPAILSPPYDLLGANIYAYVNVGAIVRAQLRNNTAAAIDLPSGDWSWETWRVK